MKKEVKVPAPTVPFSSFRQWKEFIFLSFALFVSFGIKKEILDIVAWQRMAVTVAVAEKQEEGDFAKRKKVIDVLGFIIKKVSVPNFLTSLASPMVWYGCLRMHELSDVHPTIILFILTHARYHTRS